MSAGLTVSVPARRRMRSAVRERTPKTSQMAFRQAGGSAPSTAHDVPSAAAPTTLRSWKSALSGATSRSDTMT